MTLAGSSIKAIGCANVFQVRFVMMSECVSVDAKERVMVENCVRYI